ncbi:AraC family transcriptional regulator [Devosia sp. 17-2-E-8]|nr:AraC family transcriptional regulator [Devosia sp. 17-2-E-8]
MELLQSQDLVQRIWSVVPYEQWADDLHTICGNFNPVTVGKGDGVIGAARGIDVGGMSFAHVSNNLDRVHRSMDDIRRDAKEHLFLIVQVEGSCGVEHYGRQSILDVGDCILVDSTKPTTFHFGGLFSNHLSMHLPRQIMYSEAKVGFDVARKLDGHDPMAVMLRALIAKIMTSGEDGSPHLRELMFNATRQAFVTGGAETALAPVSDSASKRLEIVDILIDRHLTDAELGAKWLATQIGVSIRTLQEDFQGLGVTCTTVIRDRRLRLARERIEQIREAGSKETIAEVAYSTGFNDISYFNRSFKELFACAPRDLLKQ